jgi:hypothetical protein
MPLFFTGREGAKSKSGDLPGEYEFVAFGEKAKNR